MIPGAEKVTNGGYDIKGCYTAPPKRGGAIILRLVIGYAMWMSIIDGWMHNVQIEARRAACVGIIVAAGVKPPGKSACFFCPSSRKHEILALPQSLQQRAIEIEARANLYSIAGLGRNFAWRDLIRADAAQCKMNFVSVEEVPCGCYDG